MQHLQEVIDHLKRAHNPGAEIGEFLQRHSASPGYLMTMLKMYLHAVEQDHSDEFNSLAARVGSTVCMGGHVG